MKLMACVITIGTIISVFAFIMNYPLHETLSPVKHKIRRENLTEELGWGKIAELLISDPKKLEIERYATGEKVFVSKRSEALIRSLTSLNSPL